MPVFVRRQRSLWDAADIGASERFAGPAVRGVFPESATPFARSWPGRRCGGGAAGRLRHRKGDRVAIASANCVEYVIAFWATTALGADHGRHERLVDRRRNSHGIELTRRRSCSPTPDVANARADPPDGYEMPVVPGGKPLVARRAAAEHGAADADPLTTGIDEDDPLPHPFHQRHHRPPQGCGALAPRQHPFHSASLLSRARLSAMPAPRRGGQVLPPPAVRHFRIADVPHRRA